MEPVKTLQKVVDGNGNRTGYRVMHNDALHFIPIGTTALIPISQPKKAATVKAVPVRDVVYERAINHSFLRSAIDDDGQCPYCDRYPNEEWDCFKTSVGMQELVICSFCEEKFKPHPAQRLKSWRQV